MRSKSLPAVYLMLLSSTAAADDLISNLTSIGGARSWATVSVLVSLVMIVALTTLIGVRRNNTRLEQKLLEVERQLLRHQKTEMILKEAHEDMESRVRDRTADLEMSYQKLDEVREALGSARNRLQSLGRVDELTGIANRKQFDETLNIEIKRNIRAQRPVSLILSEIDFFDHYRRSYGRGRADEALKKVADAISRTFKRAPDVVARYDDHSFAIILPATEVRDAMRFAERLRLVVYQLCVPHSESDVSDRLTVSVGLATMQPDKLYKANDLLAAAGRALDAAQQNRNAVEYDAIRSEAVSA